VAQVTETLLADPGQTAIALEDRRAIQRPARVRVAEHDVVVVLVRALPVQVVQPPATRIASGTPRLERSTSRLVHLAVHMRAPDPRLLHEPVDVAPPQREQLPSESQSGRLCDGHVAGDRREVGGDQVREPVLLEPHLGDGLAVERQEAVVDEMRCVVERDLRRRRRHSGHRSPEAAASGANISMSLYAWRPARLTGVGIRRFVGIVGARA
jgi:hypothetical protein